MVECRHGHPNPAGWEFCVECSEPLEEESSERSEARWYRTKWIMLIAGVVATVAVSAVIVSMVGKDPGGGSQVPGPAANSSVLNWWADAKGPFAELQQSLRDVKRALADVDRGDMQDACQRMHDSAQVALRSRLPAPTAELTSEVLTAIEDAHAASHMCMSILEGSTNNYNGEFTVEIDQAEKHLDAARELVRQAIAAGS